MYKYWTFNKDEISSHGSIDARGVNSARNCYFKEFQDNANFEFLILPEKLGPFVVFSDMDGTLVQEETLVELADHIGLKEKVESITKLAMDGHLDFEESLNKRVSLLKKTTIDIVQKHSEVFTLTQGAPELFELFKKHNIESHLVTGGFREVAEHVQQKLKMKSFLSNQFEYLETLLTGNVLLPIVDGTAKAEYLKQTMLAASSSNCKTIAFGDGANDVPLFKASDICIGINPKKVLGEYLYGAIRSFDNLTKIFRDSNFLA